jgi:hypothetical protein
MAGTEPAEAQRLFDDFRLELWSHRNWDSDFTPSPHEPGRKLRELVDRAGAAAAPLLLDALTGDRDVRSWAFVGLEWLGPAAGEAAVAVLVEHVSARRDPLPAAAVALDAIAPARARKVGVHRWPETMVQVTDRYLRQGVDATAGYVGWFVAEQADEDVVRFLAQRELRDRISHDCPERLAGILRALLHSDRGTEVRREAAEILMVSGLDVVTEELVEALCGGGPLSTAVIERVAAHPASERLVPRLVGMPGAAVGLATLIMRRGCAGLGTNPAPLRAFLRTCVEDPDGRWPSPRYGDAVPTAIAWLRDETMLEYLLPMLHADRLASHESSAVVRAFASFGTYGRMLLEQQCQRHPDLKQMRWTLDAVERFGRHEQSLDHADDLFVRGRIETTVGGAFTAYGLVLLLEPSAHAAFQLAWIDRAFGAPVTAERVEWIRALGFADDTFLAELARPVHRPLEGHRFQWDCGESRQHDPTRAARAAATGLPALATRWCRDDTFDRLAQDHIDRVRRAAAH